MRQPARTIWVTVALLLAMTAAGAAPDGGASPAANPLVGAAHFDPEAATRAYVSTLSAAARHRADDYVEGGYWLSLWDLLIGLGIAWWLLAGRVSARMRDLCVRITGRPWLHNAMYGALYITLVTLVSLPWAAYEGYFREHQYGMSNQDFAGWLGDEAKGLLIGLIFGVIGVVALYAVIRRFPATWRRWGVGVAFLLLLLQIVIGPSYLEPVFNHFYPLADSPLKQQILSLARANMIPTAQVYEFDASKQTTKISAHVSGIFGAAQISLNDNLMNRGSPEEIKAVLGHEMGHYVLNHIYKQLLFVAVVIGVGFAFLAGAQRRLQARYAQRWQIGGIGDVAGLPLLVALFSVYLFALTPLLNTEIRTEETEADAFGLNAARQPDGAAQAALQLSEYRKMQPGPIEEFFFFDHPSGWNRIHRAMVWKAENIHAPDIAEYDATHSPPGVGRAP
jgi:STE24 endopeptidase